MIELGSFFKVITSIRKGIVSMSTRGTAQSEVDANNRSSGEGIAISAEGNSQALL